MKPRVVVLIWNFVPGPVGGTERQCHRLMGELVRMGIKCTVFTRMPWVGAPRVEEREGIRIQRIGTLGRVLGLLQRVYRGARSDATMVGVPKASGDSGKNRKGARLRMIGWLQGLEIMDFQWQCRRHLTVQRSSFDLIHVQESHWLAGLGAAMGSRLGCPVLVKEASYPVMAPLAHYVPRRASLDRWRRTANYQALVPQAEVDLRRECCADVSVFQIPNGVEILEPATPDGRSPFVVFVGNLYQGALKGFDVLFEAWGVVARRLPRVRLVVIGDGDQTGPRQELAKMGIADRVEFTGRVARPSTYYQRASAFVLTSRNEGMSNALLEAQSHGLPCVVSAIPGNLGVVSDEANGLVFKSGDSAACAAQLERVLRDPLLAKRLSGQARTTVRRRFSFEIVSEQLVATYEELLQGPSWASRERNPCE